MLYFQNKTQDVTQDPAKMESIYFPFLFLRKQLKSNINEYTVYSFHGGFQTVKKNLEVLETDSKHFRTW